MDNKPPERKVGIGAYIALIFAIIFFSGLAASDKLASIMPDKQWAEAAKVLDFGTLNGSFGKMVGTVSAAEDGTLKTATTTFRGRGGSGAMDGFLFALGLVPTVMFALAMIAVLEHYGALDAARKLLTPLLRPLMDIPGSTGLSLIGSLQSTDAGASMTRALADENLITEKEKNVFTMFQFSAGAMLTNFFSSGAILFTLKQADGSQAVPVSLGLCIIVMFVMKIFGANLMRFYITLAERKETPEASGKE